MRLDSGEITLCLKEKRFTKVNIYSVFVFSLRLNRQDRLTDAGINPLGLAKNIKWDNLNLSRKMSNKLIENTYMQN